VCIACVCVYTCPSIHACIYVLIGLSECLSNVLYKHVTPLVPLHVSVAHGLSVSGFL
jgi:hypothetical protein